MSSNFILSEKYPTSFLKTLLHLPKQEFHQILIVFFNGDI